MRRTRPRPRSPTPARRWRPIRTPSRASISSRATSASETRIDPPQPTLEPHRRGARRDRLRRRPWPLCDAEQPRPLPDADGDGREAGRAGNAAQDRRARRDRLRREERRKAHLQRDGRDEKRRRRARVARAPRQRSDPGQARRALHAARSRRAVEERGALAGRGERAKVTVELGHFALVLALAAALAQSIAPFWGARVRDPDLMAIGQSAALTQFVLVAISFAALVRAHLTSDFSVLNVAENSHSAIPTIYKISGVWGNHEGSMLLWV